MEKIGDRIKKIRFEENLSQFDFAEILGIHRGHLSKLENSKINPSTDLMESICTYFNINDEWLTDGKGIMKTKIEAQFLSKDEIEAFRKKVDRINYSLFSERLRLLSDMVSYHAKIFDIQSMDFIRERFFIDHNDEEAKRLKDDFARIEEDLHFLIKTIKATLNHPS